MHLILTQCFPPIVGGIENLMGELAMALAKNGEKVLVFADGTAMDADNNMPYSIRRFGGWKFWRQRKKSRAAAAVLQSENIRHVFCDSWKSLQHLQASGNARITVFAHGSEYPKTPTTNKRRRICTALSRAHRVLAVSAAARTRMQQCGVNIQNVTIWHPPIGNAPPPDDAARQTAAQLWQTGKPKILSVARLAKRKGLDAAILAVQQLTATYPQTRYIIAGDGNEATALRNTAKQCGAEKSVVFAGTISGAEKTALYESADVFVLPAREDGNDMEGFGLVFLEAGLRGLPAVAGQVGGSAEAVEDGKTGLHCNGDDAKSVYNALSRLLSDESLRQQLSDGARQKAAANVWEKRLPELL